MRKQMATSSLRVGSSSEASRVASRCMPCGFFSAVREKLLTKLSVSIKLRSAILLIHGCTVLATSSMPI